MVDYYLKGGSNYDTGAAANVWMSIFRAGIDTGSYEDLNWKNYSLPSGLNEDPYWLLGGPGGQAEAEIGLSGDYRIKITNAGIFGWHDGDSAWYSLFGDGSGPGGVDDHGLLAGLADDDHSQYHTDARARVWLSGDYVYTRFYNVSGDFVDLSGDIVAISGDYALSSGDLDDYKVVSGAFIVHKDNTSAHHAKYTDTEARASFNDVFGSDGRADKNIDMDSSSNYKVVNLGDPTSDRDAVNKQYLENNLFLSQLSDVNNALSGIIVSLDDKSSTFPATPIDGQRFYDLGSESEYRYNANAYSWIEVGGGGNGGYSGIVISGGYDNLGSHEATTMLDMNNNKITGLADPVTGQHAVNWDYLSGYVAVSGADPALSGVVASLSGDYVQSSGDLGDYKNVSGVVSSISGDYVGSLNNLILETGISSDHKAQGIKTTQYVAAEVSFGNLLTLNTSAAYVLAGSGSVSTMPALSMATTTTSSGNTADMLLYGTARDESWSWNTASGGTGCLLYVNSGDMTQTRPSGATKQVQIVGYVLSTGEIMFNPNLPWAEAG